MVITVKEKDWKEFNLGVKTDGYDDSLVRKDDIWGVPYDHIISNYDTRKHLAY